MKSPSPSRRVILPVRCTPAEKQIFHLRAKEAGFSDVSAFIRKRCGIPAQAVAKFKITPIR